MSSIYFLILLICANTAFSKPIVNVGAYNFPPYIEISNNHITGLTPQIVKIANEIQDEVEFKLFITSANRRYQDFKMGRYDLMFFEDLSWGWDKAGLKTIFDSTDIFMTGGEVFITFNNGNKKQDYFKDITKKSKMGILGYHYSFAKFNSDPTYLKNNHNMTLSENQKSIINAITNNHFQIGIVTREYLRRYLKQNPQIAKKLIISTNVDQSYEHRIIFRKKSKSMKDGFIKSLLKKLQKNEHFLKLIEGQS